MFAEHDATDTSESETKTPSNEADEFTEEDIEEVIELVEQETEDSGEP
ncbi:hypothetical protein [Halorubrum californiense]|nr:hypothetical protein [Halorubrum californiense]